MRSNSSTNFSRCFLSTFSHNSYMAEMKTFYKMIFCKKKRSQDSTTSTSSSFSSSSSSSSSSLLVTWRGGGGMTKRDDGLWKWMLWLPPSFLLFPRIFLSLLLFFFHASVTGFYRLLPPFPPTLHTTFVFAYDEAAENCQEKNGFFLLFHESHAMIVWTRRLFSCAHTVFFFKETSPCQICLTSLFFFRNPQACKCLSIIQIEHCQRREGRRERGCR